ncbi:hypothetical protein AVEN_150867-1 [Araneus ventricosus]|uniref:Uncharacterized protein n=1 Tax=Araneus ventricosus TaxID=182803 RepID=A0A4Y2KHQ2_ARAVE|nr:hypothetical protein AVEN_150867-1 [Araneus ventricosus]
MKNVCALFLSHYICVDTFLRRDSAFRILKKLCDTCGATLSEVEKCFCENLIILTIVCELFQYFQHGHENAKNNYLKSCQNTLDVRSTVLENHQITIDELSEECSICCVSAQSILTEDLDLWRVCHL